MLGAAPALLPAPNENGAPPLAGTVALLAEAPPALKPKGEAAPDDGVEPNTEFPAAGAGVAPNPKPPAPPPAGTAADAAAAGGAPDPNPKPPAPPPAGAGAGAGAVASAQIGRAHV